VHETNNTSHPIPILLLSHVGSVCVWWRVLAEPAWFLYPCSCNVQRKKQYAFPTPLLRSGDHNTSVKGPKSSKSDFIIIRVKVVSNSSFSDYLQDGCSVSTRVAAGGATHEK
jgi:hypothetical protein